MSLMGCTIVNILLKKKKRKKWKFLRDLISRPQYQNSVAQYKARSVGKNSKSMHKSHMRSTDIFIKLPTNFNVESIVFSTTNAVKTEYLYGKFFYSFLILHRN